MNVLKNNVFYMININKGSFIKTKIYNTIIYRFLIPYDQFTNDLKNKMKNKKVYFVSEEECILCDFNKEPIITINVDNNTLENVEIKIECKVINYNLLTIRGKRSSINLYDEYNYSISDHTAYSMITDEDNHTITSNNDKAKSAYRLSNEPSFGFEYIWNPSSEI